MKLILGIFVVGVVSSRVSDVKHTPTNIYNLTFIDLNDHDTAGVIPTLFF